VALQAGAADFPWILVALVDHPAVGAGTYRALVEATAQPASLWAPSWGGRRGHPLIFDRCCYPDLLAAPEEEGMRWVVARHRDRRVEVPVDDPEIHRDVDTPEEYERLLEGPQQPRGDQPGK
jgi:molybdenum cofactor cytidylyltransferase